MWLPVAKTASVSSCCLASAYARRCNENAWRNGERGGKGHLRATLWMHLTQLSNHRCFNHSFKCSEELDSASQYCPVYVPAVISAVDLPRKWPISFWERQRDYCQHPSLPRYESPCLVVVCLGLDGDPWDRSESTEEPATCSLRWIDETTRLLPDDMTCGCHYCDHK